MDDAPPPLLEVDDITLRFGGVMAINDVTLRRPARASCSPSSGPTAPARRRSSTRSARCTSPRTATSAGKGTTIMGLRPDRVAALGIARTFQNIELFPQMTVLDNLLLGRHVRMQRSFLAGASGWGADPRRGAREPPPGRGHHRLPRDRAVAQVPGGPAAVRLPEARRARPGAGDGPRAAAARRAGRRHEPRGDRGHGPVHPRHPRELASPCSSSSTTWAW